MLSDRLLILEHSGGWVNLYVRDDDGNCIVYSTPDDIIRGFDLKLEY
jgi:hypothetical protein